MTDAQDRPQLVEHACKSLSITVNDTKWIPCSARFVMVGQHPRGTGAMHVYSLSHGSMDAMLESEKKEAFKCCTFGASSLEERCLATGDFDGRLAVWNLDHPDLPVWSVQAHSKMINAIDGCGGLNIGYGAPEIVTGSRDGSVKVWDPRQRDEPVASLEPKDENTARDCWSVAFGNAYSAQERCVVAGYDNGDIKLYDLRTNEIRWSSNVRNGICGIEFDRKDIEMNKLVCLGLESQFRVFDLRTFNAKEGGYAHLTERIEKSGTLWGVRHLPQNRDVFVTQGGNGGLHLWRYRYPTQRKTKGKEGDEVGVAGKVELLNNHVFSTQPIGSFDWSPDKTGLCVFGSYDQSVRVGIVTKLDRL